MIIVALLDFESTGAGLKLVCDALSWKSVAGKRGSVLLPRDDVILSILVSLV